MTLLKKSQALLVYISLPIILFLLSSGPVTAGYEELAEKLKKNSQPSSGAVKALPEPETARQHWLYARASTDPRKSFRHLERAVEKGGDRALKYFGTWINQAMLGTSADSQFFRRKTGEFLERSKTGNVDFWLRAARLASYWKMNDLAGRCYRTVLDLDPANPDARLQLARVALETNQLQEAGEVLEQYFRDSTERRPTYWWLKGKLFEARGADSEAYVAYSHVVNNYPDSLLLPRVEKRIQKLTLPENLYASDSTGGSEVKNVESGEVETGPVFRVQTGSFRRKKQARQFKGQLTSEFGIPGVVKQAEVDGQTYFRVRVGAAESKARAVELLNQLKESGYDGYVTRDD